MKIDELGRVRPELSLRREGKKGTIDALTLVRRVELKWRLRQLKQLKAISHFE